MKRIGIRLAFLLALFVLSCSMSVETSKEKKERVQLFDWVAKTFEDNDAGFKYYLEEIGRDEFDRRVADYRKKVAASTSDEECVRVINQWLYTFRGQHIGFRRNNLSLSEEEKRKIRAEHESAERVDWTEETFLNYLRNKGEGRSPLEGVWMLFGDSVGIVRSDKGFDVFTIRGDGLTSFPMQKVGKLTERKDGKYDYVEGSSRYTGEWMPHSKTLFSLKSDSWKLWAHKLFPVEQRTEEEDRFLRAITTDGPFMETLTRNTLYLRIPSFVPQQKPAIDQLLAKYDKALRGTANLIVDIRYGTGGGDYSHYGLIPYYYTQTIRRPVLMFRASEQNIALCESDPNWRSVVEGMKKYVGGYTEGGAPFSAAGDMPSSPNPKRVAIICNRVNGSADEALLYMAKQSYKTKIFGQPTLGAFDFSNCISYNSPDGKYSLTLTLTVTQNKAEGYGIDGIGIQPDFYIDDSVPEDQWVNYVLSIIEEGE